MTEYYIECPDCGERYTGEGQITHPETCDCGGDLTDQLPKEVSPRVGDYLDARALHPDYHEELCPECGTGRWFKHLDRDGWVTCQWNCRTCGAYLHDVLEHPCPDCGTRMHVDGGKFACNVCEQAVSFPKAKVLRRLSSDAYPERAHKPGVMAADCPLCEDGRVNGGPDGELTCSECDFYAGQYSDAWYCFGLWLESPDRVRVVGYE